MNRTRAKKILIPFAAVAAVAWPTAWAQQATLEEIVVTAERREANLQETPISIAVFSGADLQEMNIQDVEDLQAFVPNMSIGGFNTANVVSWNIRGIGSNQNDPGHDRGVGLYIDDVYYSQPVNSLLNMLDVERIEVLRGPQGTLFGRNTTGGAVRYVTRKPTNEFEANIMGTLGSFNRTDIRAVVNVPFSDTVYGRFTAASLQQDGWVTQMNGMDDLGNRDDKMLRAQIRFEPTEAVTVDLTLDYVDYYNDGAAQYMQNPVDTAGWYNTYQAANPGTPDFPVVALSPDCDVSLECSIPGTGADEFADGETGIVSVVVQWAINDTLNFKSVTSYLEIDTTEVNDWDLSVTPIFTVGPDVRYWEETSQEFQLIGTGWDDRLNWTAGLYFSDAEGERDALYSWAHPRAMGEIEANQRFFHAETANQAAFFDITARLTEQFAITAGLRYTQDDKSWFGFRDDRQAGMAFGAEADWDDTIGRFVLEYFPRDGIMIYGSYSEGYKAGFIADQISPLASVPNGAVFPFNQENVETVELGLRSEWWDNRLRFNVTLFDTDYTDLQVDALNQVFNPVTGEFEPVRFIANAGDVAMDGWELDFIIAATENLRFDASLGHLEHEIVRLDPSVNFPIQNKLPRAPEDSWKVGVRYDLALANGGNLRFGLDHGYTDTQRSSFGTSVGQGGGQNVTLLPEYELTNARVTYAAPSGSWTAALFCTNCQDEWYLRGQHDNQRNWGGADTLLGKPRMYGVEFSMDF